MIELDVLGSLELSRDGGEVRSVLAQPKRTALLAYLVLARPRGFRRRDELLGVFWPERPEDRARNALSQALYMLRGSLGAEAIESRGQAEVGIATGALSCDAVRFEDALEEGDLERALELYRGELLEGFHLSDVPAFERWLQTERERFRRRAREAALELAEAADEERDLKATARWARRALQIAPADEAVGRHLMRALDESGDRAGALRTYEILATRLERTLGVEPSPETRALADRIRERRLERRQAVQSGEEQHRPVGAGEDRDVARAESVSTGVGVEDADTGDEVDRDAPGSSLESDPSAARATVPGRTLAAWLAGLLLVTIGAVLVWRAATPPSGRAATEGQDPIETALVNPAADSGSTAVAVLPFLDLSSGSADSAFSDGLAEELLHSLARTGRLQVVARTSSFRFRNAALDVRAIGDSLGVDAVLEGSVRRSGDRVRITAQLIDAETGLHLWSGGFDRRLNTRQLFEVQARIARAITDSLRLRLGAEDADPTTELPTRDLEAYSLYLRGRHAWGQRTPDSFRRAVDLYERALARDSSFAEAWAGLASVYVLIPASPNVSGLMPNFVTRAEAEQRARRAARRALALDPDLPQGHAAMGQSLRATDERRAEAAFRRAIALNPSYATARQWLAFLLASHGRREDALAQMQRAQRLDPLSVSINGDLGRFLYYAGDHEAAVDRLRRALELGSYPQAEWFLSLALAEAGRAREAWESVERMNASGDDLRTYRVRRALVAARTGRRDTAREILSGIEARIPTTSPEGPDSEWASRVFDAVRIHAALGDTDGALAWLQRLDRLTVGQLLALWNHPYFADVRADRRAEPLLRVPGSREAVPQGRGP